MDEKSDLRQEEVEAIRELEELIGTPIPSVDYTRLHKVESTFGVSIDGEQITVLKLDGNITGKLGNKLKSLPESIGNLTSLRMLYLPQNNLITIPESIGNLTSLRYLNFRSNKLETIPDSIGNLKFLKLFLIDSNHLKSVPESIGNLLSLHELYLSENNLTTLPESISNLSSLEQLWLYQNELETLPEAIGNLKSLRILYLGRNNLKRLPESIGNLTSLKTLWLADNQLTILPESIGDLSSLRRLSLTRNNLTTLPDSFRNLTSLERLGLLENPIKVLPKSVSHLDARSLRWIEPEVSKAIMKSRPASLRSSIMSELKKEVIPAHRNGFYLEKPDEEEIRAREIEKKSRKKELDEVEKALKKSQQVKFLTSIPELNNIKLYAQISGQTQSEFIRTAIRDKIKLLENQPKKESSEKNKKISEDKLRLEELKKIRKALEQLEKKG
ncbi:MAG: leucine-rich repeat domain-containing protein [Promethearchaeota archaeon]|jgi:Leucine-rich repeat (LRR) protein